MAMQYKTSFNINGNRNQNPFNSIMSLLIFVGILVLLFFLLKGFVTVLYWVAPVLLLATLIINYKIVADYAISIYETFQTDILMGMLKVIFTIFCYPFVIGWLFIKAIFYRKMDTVKKQIESQLKQQQTDQYAEFEEISTEISKDKKTDSPVIIELPKLKEKEKNNPYDNLFDA
jgi:hypothetical protein